MMLLPSLEGSGASLGEDWSQGQGRWKRFRVLRVQKREGEIFDSWYEGLHCLIIGKKILDSLIIIE
jgi:hypothetical protein